MNTQFTDIAAKVVDLLLDVVCVVDKDGRFVYISKTCEKVFGYTQEEMLGTSMLNYIHPDDVEKTLAVANQIMRGNEQPYYENRYIRKDGRTVYIMWSARWSENDKVRVAVARDTTQYKRYEHTQKSIYKISQISHQASDLSTLYQQAHQIIQEFIDAESFIVALKQEGVAALRLAYFKDRQYQANEYIKLEPKTALSEVIKKGKKVIADSKLDRALMAQANEACDSNALGNWLGVPLVTQEQIIGALIIRSSKKIYSSQDVKLMEFVGEQFATTIERKEYERKLQHIASHDWLTGLPNRLLFNDRLDVAIKRARRMDEKLALLYMDLDGFKKVNDTLGHAKGDLLLSKVAKRILSVVRESDTVARMGGDEFTVLLSELHEDQDVELVIHKLKAALSEPFDLEGSEVSIGISVGVARFPADGEEREALFRVADNAMYDDKHINNSTGIQR